MAYDSPIDEIKDLVTQGNDHFASKANELAERLDGI